MDNGDFGVEGVRHYPNFRRENDLTEKDAPDLDYVFNITNGVYNTLRAAGYPCNFYWADTDAWAKDLIASENGGLDESMSDDVDLYFFNGHSYTEVPDGDGAALVFDSKKDDWSSSSTTWGLGDLDAEWLVLYTCDTFKHLIDPNNTSISKPDRIWPNYGNIFNGLHLILASYGEMYNGSSYAHIGQAFAENLVDGDTLKSAWLDATGVDNSPGVLSAERQETWADGQPNWATTTMESDHYWGRGNVNADISRPDVSWLGFWWRHRT